MATATHSGATPRRQCDITRHENYLKRKARTCEQCGNAFTEGDLSAKQKAAGHRARFCSRACSASSRRLYADPKEAKRAETARARRRKGQSVGFPIFDKDCVSCGTVFVAKAMNALRCDRCRETKVERVVKPCADCGVPTKGTASRLRCEPCGRKRARKAQTDKHGVTKKHRQRARRYGVAYEPISPLMVFERDGWRCQVCGIGTPKRLRGSLDNRAPELDHRIPMAMGGPHTWANVQCCCRRCNLSKGATKVAGQLRLFA